MTSERRTWNIFLMARLPVSSRGASHVFFFQLFLYLTASRQFVLFGEWRHPSALLLAVFTSALQGTCFWDFISKFLLDFWFWYPYYMWRPLWFFNECVSCQSFSLYSLCRASYCHILQTPLFWTGPNVLRMIFLSKEPTFFALVWESIRMVTLHKKE